VSPLQGDGEARGNYRIYAWTNGGTSDLTGAAERHSGVGLSFDQKVGSDWNLFARWGRRTRGDGMFNSALTGGFEVSGKAWGRGKDAIGVAYGVLRTSDAYQAATIGSAFVTSGGTAIPYEASGSERIAEMYYRIKLNDHLELSPDFQLIQRAGGNPNAATVRVLGLRASLGF
jgi:high affinity Mn2+ porin